MANWTADDLSTAKQMRLFRHSDAAIAEALGRTANAVKQKLDGKGRYTLGRTCGDCPAPIYDQNKSGLCKDCCDTLRKPETEALRIAALRAKMANDPAYRCRVRENMRRVGTEAGKDPVLTAARRERGKWLYANKLDCDEVRAKIIATRPAVGRMLRQQKLGWMPEEYWGDYLFLIRNKRLKKVEAREIILAQIAADKARRTGNGLSPFERQERALANGAKLIANGCGPMFGEALNVVGG